MGPGEENELSRRAKEMKIPNQLQNIDWGKRTKIVDRKVSVRERGGKQKFYGSRAIMTKEHQSFADYLISERVDSTDLSAIPDAVVSEIKSNVRKGAKDLLQQWKNALELLNKAFQVTNVRIPTPDRKAAWKQYEELISFSVKQLAQTRGQSSQWRITPSLIKEGQSHRYFVEVPGEQSSEVEGDSMDDIIDQLTNKLRRQGAVAKVAERSSMAAVLHVYVTGELRDKIVIKQV